jgi:hypothetical protein
MPQFARADGQPVPPQAGKRAHQPLSGGEAEPARRVGGVDVTRLRAVGRIQIQPAASWTPQEGPPVVVRGDLFNMAEMHVLVVATEIASSFALDDNGRPMLGALMPHSVRVSARGSAAGSVLAAGSFGRPFTAAALVLGLRLPEPMRRPATLIVDIIIVLAFVLTMFLVLGPFRETHGGGTGKPCNRCDRTDLHRHWIDNWAAGWPTRSRPPLTYRDWVPNSGFLFVPSLSVFLLLAIGGGAAASGDARGLLALLGGLIGGAFLVLYVRRPSDPAM